MIHTQSRNSRRRTSSAMSDHRLPQWVRDPRKYQAYMDNRRRLDQEILLTNGNADQGMDNFSYDANHMQAWQMPEGLAERLPEALRLQVTDWQKAGAALCTALDRIDRTEKNAIFHAYPDKSSNPLSPALSRRPSNHAVVGAADHPASPRSGVLLAPTPVSPTALSRLEKLTLTNSLPGQFPGTQVIGMETPPFSPVDSIACATPLNYADSEKAKAMMPDLSRVDSELSPLQSPEALRPISPDLDAKSWEYYIGRFENEMRDNKAAFMRLKGYGQHIDIARMELATELKPEIKLAVMDFGKWWESIRPKVRQYEQQVKDLEVPRVEEVKLEWESLQTQSGGSESG